MGNLHKEYTVVPYGVYILHVHHVLLLRTLEHDKPVLLIRMGM